MKNKKIRYKLCFLTMAILFFSDLNAQNENFEIISNEEYELINNFFDYPKNDEKINIYSRTYFDKGWIRYFEDLNNIFSDVGIPTLISDNELKVILNDSLLKKIKNEIIISIPLKLNKHKLSNKIKLFKSFDSEESIEKNVIRLAKPIIINNIAIFRIIGKDYAPIHIMKKESGKWQIIYTFHEWLILE